MPHLTKRDKRDNETEHGARARKESALADLREMEAAEKRGDLVSAVEAELERAEHGAAVRDELMGLPARAANRLPEEWRASVMEILGDEVRRTLAAIQERLTEGDEIGTSKATA